MDAKQSAATTAPRNAAGADVIVVGAGPTGLMATALLRRCGVSVRLIDKSPTAAKESRAFGVQPRSMELFLSIGLAEDLLDRGLMAGGAQIFVDGKQAASLDFDDIGRPDTPYGSILMVPQSEIEAVLVEDVRRHGVEVERGLEATGFAETAEGVELTARTQAGETVTLSGRYLIGADGAHSFVRKALSLTFEGAPYAQTFLLADCRIEWPLDHDHLKLFANGRAFGIFLPMKGQDIARVMAIDPSPLAADASIASQGSSAVALDEVARAFTLATGFDVTLRDAVWTSRYRVHHRGVDRYRVGRAFVAGDAAHIHSPAGGQGMNTGLQDAANLAWKLALALRGGDRAGLLDSYHAERWPVGQQVLTQTDKMFTTMTSQSGWFTGLRDIALPTLASALTRFGAVRNRAFHFISQLGIRYEPSAILVEATSGAAGKAFRDGPAAGHRAPDAAIARNRDVFGLICGYRFHVLALSRKPLDEPGLADLVGRLDRLRQNAGPDLETHVVAHSLLGRDPRLIRAESGQVFTAYGLDAATPQALYLVRPDGYVAWRTDSLDVDGCAAFLADRVGIKA